MTCSSRSRADTLKRKVPPRATRLRLALALALARALVVPQVVLPVPSGPARAVTNWKEYAHDDRCVDTIERRNRPPVFWWEFDRFPGGHLGHDPAQPRAH